MRKREIEQLFKSHYPSMYRMAMSIVQEEDVARDLVHDVFFSVLNLKHSEDVDEHYLLRAVRNRSFNYLRSLEVRWRVERLLAVDDQENTCHDDSDMPDGESLMELVHTALPPQAHEVIRRRFFNRESYAVIAEALSISEAAVYKNLRRGLDILRKRLNTR